MYGVGLAIESRGDPRPSAARLRLAVGQTPSESLARLLAEASTGDVAANERLQNAFAYDMVDAFDAADGVPRLEEELHLRGFASAPGEQYVETVMEGDPMQEVRLPEPPPRAPEDEDAARRRRREEGRRGARLGDEKRKLEFGRKRYDDVADEFARSKRS